MQRPKALISTMILVLLVGMLPATPVRGAALAQDPVAQPTGESDPLSSLPQDGQEAVPADSAVQGVPTPAVILPSPPQTRETWKAEM